MGIYANYLYRKKMMRVVFEVGGWGGVGWGMG